jgi:hypothetical protein
VVIDNWTTRAGTTWDPLIEQFCYKHNIRCGNIESLDAEHRLLHIDEIIKYHIGTSTSKLIGVELKHGDKHSSLMKKKDDLPGGKFIEEIPRFYLPLRSAGILSEIWVFIANDSPLPFAGIKNKFKSHYEKGKKSAEELYVEMEEFVNTLDTLMEFLHTEAKDMRDDESIYGFCFDHRIPLRICESQQKAIKGIYDAVMNINQVK